MATLAEIRQQYPQYQDMSDQQLGDALYQKFYSDMPRAEFDQKVGLQSSQSGPLDWVPNPIATAGRLLDQFNKPGETAGNYQPSSVPALDQFNAAANNLVRNIPVVGPTLENWGNQLDAGVSSLIEGRPVSVEERAARNQAAIDAFPVASGVGGVVGSVAPLAIAGAAVPAVGTALGMTGGIGSQMLAGGVSSFGIGGADALARGATAEDALKSAALAGTVGTVAPWLAKGAGALINGVTNKGASQAVQTLGKGLARDKVDPTMLQARLDAIGPDAVPADLGRNLTRQAAAIASLPGEGQNTLASLLTARNQATNARIQQTTADILGDAKTPAQIAERVRTAKSELSPLYTQALENGRAVDTSKLALTLDSMSVNLRGNAQKAAQNVRKMLDIATNPGNLDPNPATLFETRKAIDGLMDGVVDGNEKFVLSVARQEVDKLLAEAVPGIKLIDNEFSRLSQMEEAFGAGQQVLDSGRTAVRPDELAAAAANTAPDIFQYMRDGTRAEIDRLIGTTANNITALKSAMKGDGSWNRQRLATMFGQDKADQLLDILERESTYNRTYQKVLENSETAARTAAQKDVSPAQFGERPNGVLDLLLAAPQKLANAAARGRSEKVNAQLAELLGNRPSQDVIDQLIAARAAANRPNYLPPAAVPLLSPDERPPLRITVNGAGSYGY